MDCSPSAKRNASATLLFPEPLGPTIAVAACEKSSTVFRAKDLNPTISSRLSICGKVYLIGDWDDDGTVLGPED